MSRPAPLLHERLLGALACPHCSRALVVDGAALVCPRRHRFDLARQGYASLLQPGASAGTADTVAMVEARARFLDAGHFAPIADALAVTAREATTAEVGRVIDLGAGTGYHLAAVLDALPGWYGLAIDVSKPALRRAARAHARMGAIAADAWRRLPVQTACADLVLAVFAPRSLSEVARILAPGGAFVLVTPAAEHLQELVSELDLVTVDPRKAVRLARDTAGAFVREREHAVRVTLRLPPPDIEALALMGPSAHHHTPAAVRARLGTCARTVTCAVDITVYRAAPHFVRAATATGDARLRQP